MAKNPFDFTDMYKFFDPEDVTKMFNPSKMFSVFEAEKASPFDMTQLFDTNRKNFEAMVEANKAAASAYKDLLEKQMEVFGQMTSAARDHVAWLDETAGPEAMSKKTEAYGEAVEKALVLMRKLADNARDANEEAYNTLKGQVNEAMDELKKKVPAAKK
ncbi:MAG: phasin family protein [Mangrovicoccus sp.]